MSWSVANFIKMNPKIKKELKEWGIWLVVMAILYFSGGYVFLAAQMQKLILATGLMNASTESKNIALANYDFSVVDLDGKELHFSELKGKTVFINLWATWCPPCRAEMPSIANLYEKMHQEVVFVMISSDQEKDKLRKFAQDYPFKVYQTNQLPSVYESSSIPTSFVISPKGEIVYKREGIARYDTEEFIEFLKTTNNEGRH